MARWAAAGIVGQIRDQLRKRIRREMGRAPGAVATVIDSQSVKAAETMSRDSRGYDGAKKINGRKRHLVVDTKGHHGARCPDGRSSFGFSLRVKSTGGVVGLQTGVVGDERGGLVQRTGHLAVTVRLDPSSGLRGGGEQLREGAEDAVLAVVLVVELAQDLRELLSLVP